VDEGFRSGYEAVGWALRKVNTPIIDGPTVWEMGRKVGYREMLPGLDPWEKLAEAALILKNMERACSLVERTAVLSYFTGGTTEDVVILAKKISRDLGRDRWLVLDVCKAWARDQSRHSSEWWANKYGVNVRTIQRWALKIRRMLDEYFQNGLSKTEDQLRESGHVV